MTCLLKQNNLSRNLLCENDADCYQIQYSNKYKSLKVLSSYCEGEPVRLVKEKITFQMGLAVIREGVKSSYALSTLRFSKLRFPEAVHTVGFILNFIFMLYGF